MLVIVNALSANHPSAKHVLFGHLRQLAQWTADQHEFLVVVPSLKDQLEHHPTAGHDSESDRADRRMPWDLPNVRTFTAPVGTTGTLQRSLWERFSLPSFIRRQGGELYFTPAGTVLSACPTPQVSLAQNPWCMIDAVPKTAVQKLRAAMQRRVYARAQRSADLMAYNSRFMRDLYRTNYDVEPRRSLVVYQGIDEATHEAAKQHASSDAPRERSTIVALSFMAAWKGVDQLVRAVASLRTQGIDAQLRLVGPWADSLYEAFVRSLIQQHHLESQVTVTGRVPIDQLHHELSSARVFALPSRCESFGIPAVEAQAFGTPVVGSNTTAMAEVGGAGGHYCDPDDLGELTASLGRLLTDDQHWQQLSDAARLNADRFRWELCSKPLMQMFDLVGSQRVA